MKAGSSAGAKALQRAVEKAVYEPRLMVGFSPLAGMAVWELMN